MSTNGKDIEARARLITLGIVVGFFAILGTACGFGISGTPQGASIGFAAGAFFGLNRSSVMWK